MSRPKRSTRFESEWGREIRDSHKGRIPRYPLAKRELSKPRLVKTKKIAQ